MWDSPAKNERNQAIQSLEEATFDNMTLKMNPAKDKCESMEVPIINENMSSRV